MKSHHFIIDFYVPAARVGFYAPPPSISTTYAIISLVRLGSCMDHDYSLSLALFVEGSPELSCQLIKLRLPDHLVAL